MLPACAGGQLAGRGVSPFTRPGMGRLIAGPTGYALSAVRSCRGGGIAGVRINALAPTWSDRTRPWRGSMLRREIGGSAGTAGSTPSNSRRRSRRRSRSSTPGGEPTTLTSVGTALGSPGGPRGRRRCSSRITPGQRSRLSSRPMGCRRGGGGRAFGTRTICWRCLGEVGSVVFRIWRRDVVLAMRRGRCARLGRGLSGGGRSEVELGVLGGDRTSGVGRFPLGAVRGGVTPVTGVVATELGL